MKSFDQDGSVLDVVSFAVPYPPVYGGAIDSYYRLVALSELGVRIRFHCFTYGDKQPAKQLESICSEVYYYPRKNNPLLVLSRRPFIMSSRMSGQLISRLSEHSGPILFDGMHTCGIIDHPSLQHRPRYVRMHNIEWEYYLFLSQTAASWWKRLHFKRESIKLRKAEISVLRSVDAVMAISSYDSDYYSQRHENVTLIRPFHQFTEVSMGLGEGTYVLLQGDLSIDDNFNSTYFVAKLCAKLGVPCKIAGRSPAQGGKEKLAALQNIETHYDVSDDEMFKLMKEAQVHIIDASISSGFKLKLISSLFTARHVVARRTLVSKRLRQAVMTFSDRSEIESLVRPLMMRPISPEDIAYRKNVLLPEFSNAHNARELMAIINPE